MISFRVGSHRFHYRAAAIILDEEHLLLHRLEGDVFWALPGGRVEPGETAQDTVVREFQEELALQVRCGQLACVGENFFEYAGEPHHELGLYFYASLPGDSWLLHKGKVHRGMEGDKILHFQWFPVSSLSSLDMRPTYVKLGLASGTINSHFVQRDQNSA